MGQKDSYVFYRSFFEAINCLPKEERLQVYEAITNYALDQTEPELSGPAKSVFILVKPQLQANYRKYLSGVENGHKGAEFGKLGGRPKRSESNKPSNNPQETLIKPSNVNDNVNVNVYISDEVPSEECLPTEQTGTKKKRKTGITNGFNFYEVWSKYPTEQRIGHDMALKAFNLTVKTQDDFKAIQVALDNYLADIRANNRSKQYIKRGGNWFKEWKDWVDKAPAKPKSNIGAKFL